MKTANEMVQYCKDNRLGQGTMKSWDLKHFTLVEKALQPDEDVKMVFEGLHNYQSATKHDSNFAYAVTDRRIIMAQKKLIGETVQSVALDYVNDITFSSGLAFGIVTVDTAKEKFNIALDKTQAKNISDRLHSLLLDLKKAPVTTENTTGQKAVDNQISMLYELKELLDAGVLTQEEFEAKKKQVLGL